MNQALFDQTSVALRKAALNEEAKAYILSNPVLFAVLKKAANRYIGGERLEESVAKVKDQNRMGFNCSIEFMGESTHTAQEANDARDEFIRIIHEIKHQGLSSAVSLDLSHIGLAISHDLCMDNLHLLCQEALKANVEINISAEDSTRTDAVLKAYTAIASIYQHVGVTLQAYLYRTRDDFAEIVKLNRRIKIVKGAFETPSGISLPRGEQLDFVYLDYVEKLLSKKHPCSIATHDHKIQQVSKTLIERYHADKNCYEFESLYGVQSEQLLKLKEEGHPTKVYFVYGKEWYLYLCNRLAEYPLNVFQAIKDIVG